MDLPADAQSDEQVIWPKPSTKQRLICTGSRTDQDPAFITCHGSCGKPTIRWTMHHGIGSSMYKCADCGNTRRWGFKFSF